MVRAAATGSYCVDLLLELGKNLVAMSLDRVQVCELSKRPQLDSSYGTFSEPWLGSSELQANPGFPPKLPRFLRHVVYVSGEVRVDIRLPPIPLPPLGRIVKRDHSKLAGCLPECDPVVGLALVVKPCHSRAFPRPSLEWSSAPHCQPSSGWFSPCFQTQRPRRLPEYRTPFPLSLRRSCVGTRTANAGKVSNDESTRAWW